MDRKPSDTFKILVATDIHLGYEEDDPIRGEDSFIAFEEILATGQEQDVDFILLGGDLFHDHKPSMNSIQRCISLLRKYCMGDKPVAVEFLSNQDDIFKHCACRNVNYEDPNLNIAIPVFSIHGNHDDPCGINTQGSMDVLCSTGLINYFSKWTDLSEVRLSPLLMRKGSTKMCLFGLSHIKDERLARLFKEKKVLFERPADDPNSWCSVLVLHQNRVDRGINKYIKEEMLPNFLQIVVWGHEHECRVEPEYNTERGFRVIQPGSSVATSLCDGESKEKKIAILRINGVDAFVEPISLKTVRPFVFDTLVLRNCSFPETQKKQDEVITYVREHVDGMIRMSSDQITGDRHQPRLPLVRLRVDYSCEDEYFNPIRFGQSYINRVANPHDLILMKREKTGPRSKKGEMFDKTTMESVIKSENDAEDIGTKVVKVIEDYFKEDNNTKPLQVLSVRGMNEAVTQYVEKDDKHAFRAIIQLQKKKTMEYLAKLDNVDENNIIECIEQFRALRTNRSKEEEEKELRDFLEDDNERSTVIGDLEDGDGSDIDMSPVKTSKGSRGGRGRGRGSRSRGSAAAKASSSRNALNELNDTFKTAENDSDDDFNKFSNTSKKKTSSASVKKNVIVDSDEDMNGMNESDEEMGSMTTSSARSSTTSARGTRGSRSRGSSGTRGRGSRGGGSTSTRGRGKTSQTSIADMFASQFSSSPAKRRKMTYDSDSE